MVPIMEELFWRGFLMRFLIHSQFERLSLGQYRPVSFFVTTACFAAVHGVEWPLAVIAGLLRFLRTRTTLVFVAYRLVLGVALFTMLKTGRLSPQTGLDGDRGTPAKGALTEASRASLKP